MSGSSPVRATHREGRSRCWMCVAFAVSALASLSVVSVGCARSCMRMWPDMALHPWTISSTCLIDVLVTQ